MLSTLDTIIEQSRHYTPLDEEKLESIKYETSAYLLSFRKNAVQDGRTENLVELFRDFRSVEQKKLLVSSCLRLLLESSMRWLEEPPLRPQIVQMFDAQLERIYPAIKIDKNSQAHEKIDKLVQAAKEQENTFFNAIQSLTSLESINTHRGKLMKALKQPVAEFLISSFLPENIEARLNELYRRVDNYLEQRDTSNVVDARSKLIQEIEQFNQALSASQTIYACRLLTDVGERITQLVEKDFSTNKAIQPAVLTVKPYDKKYPFETVGKTINLKFDLRNTGQGYAHDTKVCVIADHSIQLNSEEIDLGRLTPISTQALEIPATILLPSTQVSIEIEISWSNFDGTLHTNDFSFDIKAQRNDIDWDSLAQREPYSLEPVSNEQELAGRRNILNRLIGNATTAGVGSSIIWGQKRVGKTSIAAALKSHLEESGYLVVNLETGNYTQRTPSSTVTSLGEKLCNRIRRLNQALRHITIPQFNEALSPIDDFLDDVAEIIPNNQIVIILDEFDQLPTELYSKTSLGNSFFSTLRSLSSRKGVGFVLVGGEKMQYVMECQGMELNKWSIYTVDYFTRNDDWGDYCDLIQRPVYRQLEYTDDALIALHDVTAGNPYFTKLVCKRVFEKALGSRDGHITRTEIDEAVEAITSTQEINTHTFAHFWDDAIFDLGEEAVARSIKRRILLIAVSDALAQQAPAQESLIVKQPLVEQVNDVEAELRELVTRNVLITESQDFFQFKVRLFHYWLKHRGIHDIISTLPLTRLLKIRQDEEKLRVQANEIVELAEKWGLYRGQPVTSEKIRAWLEQFTDVREQRTMFALLQGLRYFSNSFIRGKMHEVHNTVKAGLTRQYAPKEQRRQKQSDILISYLDGIAKSGAETARLYSDEASIYAKNVIEKSQIIETLSNRNDIKALVFIDDFVGTGKSVVEYLGKMDAEISQIILERSIKVVFVAVVAFIEGWNYIETHIETLKMPVKLHVCEVLEETERCFGEKSRIFKDQDQKQIAKKAASQRGQKLEPKCPLGYGGLELAVVFERGCPNNSLPILWSEGNNPKWVPLFKRH